MDIGSKPLIENALRIYVGTYIRSLYKFNLEKFHATNIEEATTVIDRVGNSALQVTHNEKQENLRVAVSHVSSNLGRGYIFYFNCKGCGRRARYLYITNDKTDALCRRCQMLVYRKQKESDKRISKLLNDPELLYRTINSPRIKDQLLATEAYLVKEELEERAKIKVEKGILKRL